MRVSANKVCYLKYDTAEESDYALRAELKNPFEDIRKAKQLLDEDIITEEEFTQIKSKLISKI